MRLSGALCAGSDAWFPDNNRDRAVVVELCRTACPAYRDCLEFAMSGIPLYGVVAGLNMGERDRMHRAPEIIEATCRVCHSRFEYPVGPGGRRRKYCSKLCQSRRRSLVTS